MPHHPPPDSPDLPLLRPAYADLTERFYRYADAIDLAGAKLVRFDADLAAAIGLDAATLDSPGGLAWLGGMAIDAPRPVAMAYAGHQFGRFSRLLGDGRTVILGHLVTERGTLDIALKGGGPTPFTTRGDGFLSLESAVREFDAALALRHRGIPAAGILGVFATGRTIQRGSSVVEAGVIVRTASSHIRIGTFQYAASRRDLDALARLVQWTLTRYPRSELEWVQSEAQALLESVAMRYASMTARWMAAGFAHGMLNTDNVLLSNEALDVATASFARPLLPSDTLFDQDPPTATSERYLLRHQPAAMRWNLKSLGSALAPLLSSDPARSADIIANSLRYFERQLLAEINA